MRENMVLKEKAQKIKPDQKKILLTIERKATLLGVYLLNCSCVLSRMGAVSDTPALLTSKWMGPRLCTSSLVLSQSDISNV